MNKDKNCYKNLQNSFSSNKNQKNSTSPHQHNYSSFEKNRNLIKKIKYSKNKKHKKIMLILKLIILAIILFLSFMTFAVFSKFNKKLNLSEIGLTQNDETAEKQLSEITNIALLGIDDNNVSDAIMLASINTKNKKINLISIARDSLVKIEPKNKKSYYSKINEAYSNGNEETTLKAINKNFNLRIMEYITINFDGLGDVIDALGGLDLEISKKESNQIDGIINSTKILKKKHPQMLRGEHGLVHLNGSQAVAYARIRKVETLNGLKDDFGRTYRQRFVMNLIFQKAKNFEKSKIFQLINSLLPNIKTSLDLKTITNIYSCIRGNNYKIEQTQIPTPPYTIDPDYTYNSKSTVFYDLNYAGKLINAIIYEDADQQSYIEENPPKNNNHKVSKSSLSKSSSFKITENAQINQQNNKRILKNNQTNSPKANNNKNNSKNYFEN